MALIRGRLFAGALFAGALFGVVQVEQSVQTIDLHQGVARFSPLAFKRIVDAEARFDTPPGIAYFTPLEATANAFARCSGDTGYSSCEWSQGMSANGFANFSTKTGTCESASVQASAGGLATLSGMEGIAERGVLHGVAGASPIFDNFEGVSEFGSVWPTGVLNPSDEELIALIYSIRKNRLDRW